MGGIEGPPLSAVLAKPLDVVVDVSGLRRAPHLPRVNGFALGVRDLVSLVPHYLDVGVDVEVPREALRSPREDGLAHDAARRVQILEHRRLLPSMRPKLQRGHGFARIYEEALEPRKAVPPRLPVRRSQDDANEGWWLPGPLPSIVRFP